MPTKEMIANIDRSILPNNYARDPSKILSPNIGCHVYNNG